MLTLGPFPKSSSNLGRCTDEKIIINVGGVRHETLLSTLLSKPGTKLSYIAKRHEKGTGPAENFFDRHPGVFSTVMDYYRSGELHMPLDVCGAVVKRELEFWGISDSQIQPCCWVEYSSFLDNQTILAKFNRSEERENKEIMAVGNLVGWRQFQMRVWMILDHPRSSRPAMIYAVSSFLFVLASIAGFCTETSMENLVTTQGNATQNGTDCGNNVNVDVENSFLKYLDYICTAFFTSELIVRIVFAPFKLKFFQSPMNIIDILALLPLYAQIIVQLLNKKCQTDDNTTMKVVYETIFLLRIIRIFRIFHLVKHYKALMILVHAIRASVQELLMLAIFLFIAMLIFSTLVYYTERFIEAEHRDIPTIPMGFWWSIITMTTVGYGDVKPKTSFGHLVGGVCAVCGVLLVALTIPVISNNFTLFYLHARTRDKIVSETEPMQCDDDDITSPTSRSNTPNGLTGKKAGIEGQALLGDDTNSTTDESGIMLHGKTGEETSGDNHTHSEPRAPLVETSQL